MSFFPHSSSDHPVNLPPSVPPSEMSLEDWIALEGEYSNSLFGTIEDLKASVLRLPVTGGARVNLRAVKNVVSSAIDIMQAMGSSVCSLLSRLSAVAAKEKSLLDECRVLLAATAGMQLKSHCDALH